MIGVTGTKGKTTTTHMIKSVLEAAGRKVGMIGTNGIYYMGRHKDTANTTPESYELQKTFREFLDAGCDTALMEVSSQGLMMDRVAGVHYDVGVFTNLSPGIPFLLYLTRFYYSLPDDTARLSLSLIGYLVKGYGNYLYLNVYTV